MLEEGGKLFTYNDKKCNEVTEQTLTFPLGAIRSKVNSVTDRYLYFGISWAFFLVLKPQKLRYVTRNMTVS